uniref:Pentraxin (PTX) domain-containing protein n=1 Tax=Melopsittacus undulatus TaxID=13146 RepID=A0A8V5GMF5_MELUD
MPPLALLLLLGVVRSEPPPPRFLCTPIPADSACADPGPRDPVGTVLRLREALVRQREAALELAAKLGRCEAERGRGHGGGGRGRGGGRGGRETPPPMRRRRRRMKRRGGHRELSGSRQSRNASGLREALQKKIRLLELQLHPHGNNTGPHGNGRGHHGDHNPKQHPHGNHHSGHHHAPPSGFLLSFPLRTNYQFAVARGPVLRRPLAAVSVCCWLRPAGGAAGLGTPFSYAAPGQPNELVLLAWGGRPLELLVNDQAVALSLSPTPGRWHHVCVTWSSAGGTWRSFQDGAPRGVGAGLAPGHVLRAGGVLVVGQEQDSLGGRFDASQSFQGSLSGLELWGRVLTPPEVAAVATCGARPPPDLLAWTRPALELHGGVTARPFQPCT